MGRQHVHMATAVLGATSGPGWRAQRSDSVVITVDMARAMRAGITFFQSDNGVVLSEGPIPVAFFAKVADVHGNVLHAHADNGDKSTNSSSVPPLPPGAGVAESKDGGHKGGVAAVALTVALSWLYAFALAFACALTFALAFALTFGQVLQVPFGSFVRRKFSERTNTRHAAAFGQVREVTIN